MSINALKETRRRAPHGWRGVILDDASGAFDRVRVRITAYGDSRQYFGPMPFMPRGRTGADPATLLPSAGDPCLVQADDARNLYITWWEPA